MPFNFNKLPHQGIQSLAPYIPGKSVEEVAKEQGLDNIIKLASNENPLGCSPKVRQVLAGLSDPKISMYTGSANHPLRSKLANQLGVTTEQLTLGSGSDSLFCLLLTCFALNLNKHILTHQYAFISYEIQAQTLGIPVIKTSIDTDFQVNIEAIITACNPKTALIFLANPNNPTGLLIPHDKIVYLLQRIPKSTIVVLDEAYHEYINDEAAKKSVNLLSDYPNLVITRTFSKAYGLAALRVGYAIANPSITSLLYRIQLPFAVNQAALTAATSALEDQEFIKRSIANNQLGLKYLQQGLSEMGLYPLPSEGNFITFNCLQQASTVFQKLQQCGIIVRPLDPYGLSNYLRVSVGTPTQNNRFLSQLKPCL